MFYSCLPTILFSSKFASSARLAVLPSRPKFSSPATTTLPAISTLPSIELRLIEIFFFVLPFIRAACLSSPVPHGLRAGSGSPLPLSLFRSLRARAGRPRRFSRLSVRSCLFFSRSPRRVLSLCVSRGDGWTTAPLPRPPYDRCLVSIGRHVFFGLFTGDEHYQLCMCTPMSFTWVWREAYISRGVKFGCNFGEFQEDKAKEGSFGGICEQSSRNLRLEVTCGFTMVGKELVVKRNGPVDIREIAAKATLREVRQSGHTYVELRRVGKRVIFFCTICLTECFSDNVLFDHLKGNLHSRRYAEAKVTLFGPMPWPFNDGVLFFNNSREKDPLLLDSSSQSQSTRELALVPHPEVSRNDTEVTSKLRDGSSSCNGAKGAHNGGKGRANGRVAAVSEDHVLSNSGTDGPLVIPSVLIKDVVSDLPVHLLGYGNISYRICEASKNRKISKIWCAWVGQEGSHGSESCNTYEQSGFAIVNFSYTYDLGRKWSSDEQDLSISAGSFFVIDDAGHRGKRRKKSFSDQEASSEESNGQNSSPQGSSQAIVTGSPAGTSHNLQVGLLSSKSARRELRKQKRIAAEKVCDICGRPMLPGKDVATLLNCNTGNLACSSRNSNGAYHLFHTSCLLHWTILCQYEMLNDQIASKGKSNRGRKAKNAPKKSKITSIVCPECQGTGIHVDGDELEKPSISLSEMFRFKLKAIEAHKAWLKSPEVLKNCSTGLHFPSEHVENSEEKVMPLKSLPFYAADG